jgi:hypothetical protein
LNPELRNSKVRTAGADYERLAMVFFIVQYKAGLFQIRFIGRSISLILVLEGGFFKNGFFLFLRAFTKIFSFFKLVALVHMTF